MEEKITKIFKILSDPKTANLNEACLTQLMLINQEHIASQKQILKYTFQLILSKNWNNRI